MILSGIVAMDRNGLIGNGGRLPWEKIPVDMKRFVSLTTGKPIIMGRKTHESIGRALPKRTNIILTSRHLSMNGCYCADSVPQALAYADGAPEAFFIGGAAVYKKVVPNLLDRFYVTRIDAEFSGDVYFPDPDWELDSWQVMHEEHVRPGEGTEWPLVFQTYERRRAVV